MEILNIIGFVVTIIGTGITLWQARVAKKAETILVKFTTGSKSRQGQSDCRSLCCDDSVACMLDSGCALFDRCMRETPITDARKHEMPRCVRDLINGINSVTSRKAFD